MQMKSKRSSMSELFIKIKTWIHDVFNRDFFSIYEGVIESYDARNDLATVRIPELDNIQINDCRYAYPARGLKCPIYSGDHVLIAFRSFSLATPVIFAYLSPSDSPLGFTERTIIINNGQSSITIDENSIKLNAPSVTANGEDLSHDDIGAE